MIEVLPTTQEDDDAVVLVTSADVDSLRATRSRVEHTGRRHGLDDFAVTKFVLAVHELVVNAARHGGGHAEIRIWTDDTGLRCTVTDQGRGIPRRYVRGGRPAPTSIRGWGLWLVHQICRDVQVETGRTGTRVTICYAL